MNLTIARGELELGQLDAEKARELLALNFLRPTDLFWEEGMPEWLPIAQLPPPQAIVTVAAEASWLSVQTDRFLNKHWPEIREAVMKQAGTLTRQIVGDDRVMKEVFTAAYKFLPTVITLVVREQTFVAFCLSQRDRLLAP